MEEKSISMTKHDIREAAFLLLYQTSLTGDTIEEAEENMVETFELQTVPAVRKLADGVTSAIPELDEVISRFSKTREVARIPKINLTALRIAIYEILHCPDVPKKVAINEAIELTKSYGGDKDRSFVSGLLGAYYRELSAND